MTVQSIVSLQELKTLISSGKSIAIDYFATWCGPCKMIAPKMEMFSTQFPSVTFLKVDVDSAQEIAKFAEIKAMPTLHFYKNGSKVADVVGADLGKIEKAIKEIA